MCRYSCRHAIILTLASVVAFSLSASPPYVSESLAEQGHAVVATCVTRGQDITPLPGVRILLHPDSTRAVSDEAGDFILQWSGKPGWINLTVTAEELGNIDWCVRLTLPSPSDREGQPYIDLGNIQITPGRRVHSTRPELPHGASPRQITPVPDPSRDEPIEGMVRYRLSTDIHGNVRDLGLVGTDVPPPAVASAVEAWIMGLTWRVGQYTTCDDDAPFNGDIRVGYVWKGGSWHFDDGMGQLDRRLRHGRPESPDR